MKADDEGTPLLAVKSTTRRIPSTLTTTTTDEEEGGEETQPEQQQQQKLMTILENILDWSPFIVVQILGGGLTSLTTAFLGGTMAAVLVIFYSYLKSVPFTAAASTPTTSAAVSSATSFQPKILDLGQFYLFGSLYLLALISEKCAPSPNAAAYIQQQLFLWFNPLTTGGMALIMYMSIVNGRPFVYDYVEAQMPSDIYKTLMSKQWFRNILQQVAMFWVKTLTAMTIIVMIQPILVTIFYGGNPSNDLSGYMNTMGISLTVSQFAILAFAFHTSHKMRGKDAEKTKRVEYVKKHGLTKEEQFLYGDAINVIYGIDTAKTKHKVQSLTNEQELDVAADVLADAFQNYDMVHEFVSTKEGKVEFFKANMKASAVFHHIFACFDTSLLQPEADNDHDDELKKKPQCVMACVPVYSESHEEIDIFLSIQAWMVHGYLQNATSPTMEELPIPNDDLFEVGQLKKKKEHGLVNNKFIYIAFFGTDPSFRGQGYGRTLLKHVIALSEQKKVPLVLETGTETNRRNYEKYGFQVVDKVQSRPDWVLMIRPVV